MPDTATSTIKSAERLLDVLRVFGHDLVHAVRSLAKARSFTFVCVASLGIGMGTVIGMLAATYGLATGIAVAFARTHVIPCLLTPRDKIGRALQIRRTTAALELEEGMYTAGSEPVAYARDLFAEDALDVTVMRSLDATSPVPIATGRRNCLLSETAHPAWPRRSPAARPTPQPD